MKKVFIAIPCMDEMPVDFVRSLVGLRSVGHVSVNFLAGALVYASRDELMKRAVMEEADYILWLDSDMVFKSDLLIDLMKHMDEGKDFVSGIYHKRKPPFNPVIYKTIRLGMTDDERVVEEYDDYPDEPFQIDACGFGVVLHKIQIAKDMLENGGAFQPLPGYGEDISFCIRAKRLGYDMWADPKIQAGHIAKTVSDRDTFEAWRRNNA